jgi:hypothetical protein
MRKTKCLGLKNFQSPFARNTNPDLDFLVFLLCVSEARPTQGPTDSAVQATAGTIFLSPTYTSWQGVTRLEGTSCRGVKRGVLGHFRASESPGLRPAAPYVSGRLDASQILTSMASIAFDKCFPMDTRHVVPGEHTRVLCGMNGSVWILS